MCVFCVERKKRCVRVLCGGFQNLWERRNFLYLCFPVDVSVETLTSGTVDILWSDRSNEIHRGFFPVSDQ